MTQFQGNILPYKGKWPKIADDVFIAPGASVIGDVEIGAGSSVWFNTVIRGDENPIRIGEHVQNLWAFVDQPSSRLSWIKCSTDCTADCRIHMMRIYPTALIPLAGKPPPIRCRSDAVLLGIQACCGFSHSEAVSLGLRSFEIGPCALNARGEFKVARKRKRSL